jgi:hypothetical protein
MADTQPKPRITMDLVLERRRGRKWTFWTFDVMRQMTPEQWLTACCPMAAVDCPTSLTRTTSSSARAVAEPGVHGEST